MSALGALYSILLYLAGAVFVIGLGYKIWIYARTPAPLKIATTPAPVGRLGVVGRILREVVLFESLFKSNKWTWLFGWLFHISLLLVILRHLRYFLEPVPTWVVLLQPFGMYAGFGMAIGLAGLWLRRVAVSRVRVISQPSDHLHLLLLLVIAVSGLAMTFVWHTDVIGLKAFTLGLVRAAPQALPGDGPLLVHLALVAVLLIVFPVSKLVHLGGIFFSPTRSQADNPREKRHLAPWAADLESR